MRKEGDGVWPRHRWPRSCYLYVRPTLKANPLSRSLQVAGACQRKFACSTSVVELPGKGAGHEVVLQVGRVCISGMGYMCVRSCNTSVVELPGTGAGHEVVLQVGACVLAA